MKVQFQSGYGEVRGRFEVSNHLSMPPFYVAMELDEAFGARGGSFESSALDSKDEKAPDVVITYHPELTEPPLSDIEVWQYIADLLEQQTED